MVKGEDEAEGAEADGKHWLRIIHYLRPYGRKVSVEAPVSLRDKEYAISRRLVITAEVIPGGKVALWLRRSDEDETRERMRIARNDGKDPAATPEAVLAAMIEEERQAEHKRLSTPYEEPKDE